MTANWDQFEGLHVRPTRIPWGLTVEEKTTVYCANIIVD